MDSSFWKNKKVLITGHTGFVGTWLIMTLQSFGADICGVALKAESGSLFESICDKVSITDCTIDIRDKELLEKRVMTFKPEIVFHLAAFGFIQECLDDPETAFLTNTVGTYNVLNTVFKCGSVKSVIIASSDKVYKNEGKHCLFSEDDSLGGVDPYSASKTCEDIIARSYFDTYLNDKGIGMCIVRPSNILGGGDHHFNRLIPSIFRAFDEEREPIIRNPQAVRPWQDILDMCDAYLFLAERANHERNLDIVNVGPEAEGVCTVGEISSKVGQLFGKTVSYHSDDVNAFSEQMWLGLSIQKIKNLGWSPKMTIDDTLKNVFQCYKCKNDDELFDACMSQIDEYYRE